MKNYVIINGTNSNTITGLMINELPPISKPQMRTLIEEIDGRDGDIITDLGYSSYDKTFTIGLFGTGYDINEIISFFNDSGIITFSNEADKYYYFKTISKIDYERLQKFKTASITVHCQPFKYPLEETPLEIEYEYVEQDDVESANMTNTEGEAPLKISLKGNTSQTGTPTPDSPIPINVVSGDNEVVVCGKNLLNFNKYIRTSSNITYNSQTNNSVSASGTNAWGSFVYFFANVEKNTDYTLSINTIEKGCVSNKSLQIVGNSTTSTSGSTTITSKNIGTLQLNTPTDAYVSFNSGEYDYIGLVFWNNYSATALSTSSIWEINEAQLEKGTSSSQYEPYQSQTYPVNLPVENLWSLSDTYTSTSANQWVLADTSFHLSKGTYTISFDATVNKTVQFNFKDGNNVAHQVNVGTNGTFTTDVDLEKVAINISSTNNTISNIQLEKGSKANSYTPYGQTPIKMRGIGDYQDYFTKNSGKNLLNKATITTGKTFNGTTGEIQNSETNSISDYIEVKENTEYCFSGFSQELFYAVMVFYDESKNILSVNNSTISSNKFVRTTPTSCKYVRVQFKTINTDVVQFELGDSRTTYEPYGTGQWCKYNAIGKVVLDGSEDINMRTTGMFGIKTNPASVLTANPSELIPAYCNRAIANTRDNVYNGTNGVAYGSTNNYYNNICLRLGNITSIDDFKTYAQNNETIVYYVLATPYLSLIEDNNLIEQLDNIESAFSYEGTTNIGQVNNDKAFKLDLKAMKKDTNEVIVNNIGNATSKPTIALEGTGNINIYLNGTQMLTASLTDKMTIDTNKMEAYNPDTSALLNRHLVGDISKFTLSSGNNTIKMDGNLTQATITNYTRWI